MENIELTDLELVNLPIFEDIDPSKIRAMISCLGGYVRYYKKNEYVLMDEEMTMNVCVLITGTVHMLKEDEDGHLSDHLHAARRTLRRILRPEKTSQEQGLLHGSEEH